MLPSRIQSDSFIEEVNTTIKVLENEKKIGIIKGSLVEIQAPGNLVVVGDIHGDMESLCAIMQNINHQKFLSDPNNKIIFLGDYIDRGSNSIGVLRTVFYLKREYPNSVILLCGNHEAIDKYYCATHTLPNELSSRFEEMSGMIYDKLFSLFRLLPKVVIIKDHLLLIHGGVPTCIGEGAFYDAISDEDDLDEKVAEELLWNDPRSDIPNNLDYVKSRRGFGMHFGKNISKKYLASTQTKVLVRSHEPCHGFKIDHDDMVLTLFSTKEAYQKFDAAYILITKEELASVRNASHLAQHVKKIKRVD
ncbi:MAG TPA: metallophosphoesterase family protein [Candidatus Nitrosotenuis sp.]|jgi:protein phosphatase